MATETKTSELTTIDLKSAEVDRLPNYLYKYRPINEFLRQLLVKNRLYCSSPKHFNDSLDCRIPTELSGQADDVRSYCYRLLTERWPPMSPDERHCRIERFVSEGRWQNTARDVQRIVDNCGVLCLSEQWGIPCMWIRYAQDHTGVCLEFLAADEKGLTDFGFESLKITYSEKLEFNLLAECWEQARRILLTKLTKWSYEQEWRIILRSSSGESKVVNFLFPPEFLTSVIFGYKADDTTKEQVMVWLAEGNCHPIIYQTDSTVKT